MKIVAAYKQAALNAVEWKDSIEANVAGSRVMLMWYAGVLRGGGWGGGIMKVETEICGWLEVDGGVWWG